MGKKVKAVSRFMINNGNPIEVNEETEDSQSKKNEQIVASVCRMFQAASDKRQPFLPLWDEIANYMLPVQNGFYNIDALAVTSPVAERLDVYDDTAANSLVKTASALYSFTANPATEWFSFSLPIIKDSQESYIDLCNDTDIRKYLVETKTIVAKYLNRAISSAMHPVMQETMAFSTSAIYLKEEDDSALAMTAIPVSIRELYILDNSSRQVDKVMRVVQLTAEQAAEQFGVAALHKEVSEQLADNPYKANIYIHAIYPRTQRDVTLQDNKNKKFASVWVDYRNKHLVGESGVDEFPYGVSRINVHGNMVYGYSPGMMVRNNVKSLNKTQRQKLEAGDKALNPPMNVPMDTYPNPVSLKPAALNYYEIEAGNALASPMNNFGPVQIAQDNIQDLRAQVKEGLLNDLVQPVGGDTTYHAQQEQLLQLRLMAPWQGGFEKDLLGPLVIRAFNILTRHDLLPEAPQRLLDYLQGGKKKIQLVYESPLANAQKFPILQGIDRTIQFAGGLAPVGGMDSIKVHETIKLYSALSGAPVQMLNSDTERAAIIKQREDAMKAQQEQQNKLMMAGQVPGLAKAAKDMSDVDPEKMKSMFGQGA